MASQSPKFPSAALVSRAGILAFAFRSVRWESHTSKSDDRSNVFTLLQCIRLDTSPQAPISHPWETPSSSRSFSQTVVRFVSVPELHVNYRFVVDFCKRTSPGGKILDYGCGSGEIVRAGLAAGLDIIGCETFYAGGHGAESAVQDLLGTSIFKMENGSIPFASESFDCIVNNQVFEHVEDLDFVLSEIRRVLKSNGVLLSMFPSKDVIREGHCGIPLAHRFAKYPRFGYYWLLLGRL